MGEDNLFTLSHIQHSILATETPPDGLPPVWSEKLSNRENLMSHAMRYFPILRNASPTSVRFAWSCSS